MTGWHWLIHLAICAWGAGMFLKLTAAEIQGSELAIGSFEERMRRAHNKRMEALQSKEASVEQAAA